MLKPAELGIIPKGTKTISLTPSFNYKRRKDGSIEERKSSASKRGDQMRAHIQFDPACTSAPMVDRMAVRMVIAHSVENGWTLEHVDVRSAFLHEEYKYVKPVCIKEMPRADGTFKHGGTVGFLRLNLYGNPSGTFYYIKGLMAFLRKLRAKMNHAESCLLRLQMAAGTVIPAVATDDFIVAAETPAAMNEFYTAIK